jgi:hypothetical protein
MNTFMVILTLATVSGAANWYLLEKLEEKWDWSKFFASVILLIAQIYWIIMLYKEVF